MVSPLLRPVPIHHPTRGRGAVLLDAQVLPLCDERVRVNVDVSERRCHRLGGVYADLDFECLRPFEEVLTEDCDVVLGQMGADLEFEHAVPNALMASRPGAKFWELVWDEMLKRRTERSVEGSTGPIMLHAALRRWNALPPEQRTCRVVVLPPVDFYPVDWNSVDGQV